MAPLLRSLPEACRRRCRAVKLLVPGHVTEARHRRRAQIAAVRELGGTVELVGESFYEAQVAAQARAAAEGRVFVSAYDDPYTIAGQGTIGCAAVAAAAAAHHAPWPLMCAPTTAAAAPPHPARAATRFCGRPTWRTLITSSSPSAEGG